MGIYICIADHVNLIDKGTNGGNVFNRLSRGVQSTMSDEIAASRTLELYVRSLSSGAGVQVESIIDRLETFATEGYIDDYTVTVWGERVSTGPAVAQTDSGGAIRRCITEFRRWANQHDVTLEGGFERQTVHSSITSETHEFITLPSVTLAARRDGDLEWVVPSSDTASAETTTPMDRVRSIANDWQESEAIDRAVVPSDD